MRIIPVVITTQDISNVYAFADDLYRKVLAAKIHRKSAVVVANHERFLVRVKAPTATCGGTAHIIQLDVYTAPHDTSGGFVVSGSSDFVVAMTTTCATSGGYVVSGSTGRYDNVDCNTSGGYVVSGAHVVEKAIEHAAVGGGILRSTANISTQSSINDTRGGYVISGMAEQSSTMTHIAAGGAILKSVVLTNTHGLVANTGGGYVVKGEHTVEKTLDHTATGGGILRSEVHTNTHGVVANSSGGYVVSGEHTVEKTLSHTAAGGAVIRSIAQSNSRALSYSTSGGYVVNGASVRSTTQSLTRSTTGGYVVKGSSLKSAAQSLARATSGGYVVNGSSIMTKKPKDLVVTAGSFGVRTYGYAINTSILQNLPLTADSYGAVRPTANIPGVFSVASVTPNAGTTSINVTFTPTDAVNYVPSTHAIPITVNRLSVAYNPPNVEVTYSGSMAVRQNTLGLAMDIIVVHGGSSTTHPAVPPYGSFDVAISAGSYTIIATPADTTNYTGGGSYVVTIRKADQTFYIYNVPSLSVGEVGDIVFMDYDTSFNSNPTFTAVANNSDIVRLTGNNRVTYTDPTPAHSLWPVYNIEVEGVIGGTGTVDVTLLGDNNYNPAYATVTMTVSKVAATIEWLQPADITYGAVLSVAQLNATANVPGVFTYTPPASTLLSAGDHALAVTFEPTDTSRYTAASDGVWLTVRKAYQTGFISSVSAVRTDNNTGLQAVDVVYSGGSGAGQYYIEKYSMNLNGDYVLSFVFDDEMPQPLTSAFPSYALYFTAVGDYKIVVCKAGDSNYYKAESTYFVNVDALKLEHPPMAVTASNLTVGGTVTAAVSGLVGDGTVRYVITEGYYVASVHQQTGLITALAAGTFRVTVDQATGSQYKPGSATSPQYTVAALPAFYVVSVSGDYSRKITFVGGISGVTYADLYGTSDNVGFITANIGAQGYVQISPLNPNLPWSADGGVLIHRGGGDSRVLTVPFSMFGQGPPESGTPSSQAPSSIVGLWSFTGINGTATDSGSMEFLSNGWFAYNGYYSGYGYALNMATGIYAYNPTTGAIMLTFTYSTLGESGAWYVGTAVGNDTNFNLNSTNGWSMFYYK